MVEATKVEGERGYEFNSRPGEEQRRAYRMTVVVL